VGLRIIHTRTALVLTAASLLTTPGLAQETRRWEVEAFSGGYFGSRTSLTPTTDTRISDGTAFGLRGAFKLNGHFRLEASLSRAYANITTLSPTTGALLEPVQPARVTTYEVGALYGFGGRRVRGYLGLGAGAMTLPSFGREAESKNDTRFAASITLAGEFLVNERLGLRIDGKYHWRAADRHLGAVVCESVGCLSFPTNLYSSAEVTGGVTYRFGEPLGFTSEGKSEGSDDEATPQRHFRAAALDVAILDALPFALNRWVFNYDFARVTPEAIKANFRSGFTYDTDPFSTNQFRHAYHGAFYVDVARANGYGFWESGAFALIGSFLWECCTEIEPPAINDLINTTLSGMTMGEISHRLSEMALDRTASGSNRLWHEIDATLIDPVGSLDRLLSGGMWKDGRNPDDRFPSRFGLDCDLGYRHVDGLAAAADQGVFALSVLYGDPFARETDKPFDSFSLGLDLTQPAPARLSRVEQEGILKGWDLSDPSAEARHLLGVFMGYEYFNNAVQIFSTESFSVGLLSRYRLGSRLQAQTGISATVFPLAAIRTTDSIDPVSGRSYDYAPGGGLRFEGSLHLAGREIASLAYRIAWAATADGPSTSNTIQFFRASALVPLGDTLGAGARYSWYSRQTSYAALLPQHRTQSDWRVFLRWSL
jgi:hypothetical protein